MEVNPGMKDFHISFEILKLSQSVSAKNFSTEFSHKYERVQKLFETNHEKI